MKITNAFFCFVSYIKIYNYCITNYEGLILILMCEVESYKIIHNFLTADLEFTFVLLPLKNVNIGILCCLLMSS